VNSDTKTILMVVPVLGIFVLGLVVLGMWGCPQYNVYQQKLEGESELAKANYSKQVAVQEAVAKESAASHLADAEIARAKGVAGANKIIGDSLKNNEGYLRWLYIEALKEKSGTEVIYVPTEAGLPILEAGKRIK
jgi:regulator of protease activity HflC (stomatin/prohibitin superfamily)